MPGCIVMSKDFVFITVQIVRALPEDSKSVFNLQLQVCLRPLAIVTLKREIIVSQTIFLIGRLGGLPG